MHTYVCMHTCMYSYNTHIHETYVQDSCIPTWLLYNAYVMMILQRYSHVCLYMPTNMHTYIHTYIHSYIHTFIHTWIRTHVHSYAHACIQFTHIKASIHIYICVCIHKYVQHTYLTYILTYILIYMMHANMLTPYIYKHVSLYICKSVYICPYFLTSEPNFKASWCFTIKLTCWFSLSMLAIL